MRGILIHKNPDLRVKRTNILLRDALITLIAEKGFDAVTVGDIAERAMINRATFYRHYEDKYALVTNIFEDAAEKLINELGPLEQRMGIVYLMVNEPDALTDQTTNPEVEHALIAFTALFEHIAKYAKLYKTLLGKYGSSWFQSQLRDYIANNLEKRLQESQPLVSNKSDVNDPISNKALTICLANWFVGTLTWWLEDDMRLPPRKIAVLSLRFIIYGMFPYIESLNFPRTRK
jgi:AcrR family transcriptional regulator